MNHDNKRENNPDGSDPGKSSPYPGESSPEAAQWNVLVVDDEEDVHTVTRLALGDITFEGERLRILDAYSAEEGRRMFDRHPDIAIVLLDVVMETQTSGLEMVKYIRRDLGNTRTRIILRTGHPGQAPEREVIEAYDINDYKTKTELTSDSLFTIIIAGLRSYKAYKTLETYGRDQERKVRRRTRELLKSEAKYRSLFDNINSGVAVYEAVENGDNFVFVDFNRAGERIDRIDKEKLIGKSVADVFPGIREFGLLEVFRRVWSTGVPERHPVARYEDGRILGWRDNFVYKLPSGEIVAAYTDETARKQSEEATRRATRALEMRNELNKTILRARSEGDFFDGICRVIVDIGKYKTAWIDLAGGDGGGPVSTRPPWDGQGCAGNPPDASEDREIGPPPPVIHQDIPNNPECREWRAEAAKHGYASSAAFPLVADNRFIGSLNIHDAAPRRFTTDEVDLLTGLANDLAHGVMSLRARKERKRAETARRESEDRMTAQFRGVPVPTYIWRRVGEDFFLIDFNDAALKITDGKIREFTGTPARELYNDEPEMLDGMRRCFELKTTMENEIHHRMKATTASKHLAVKYAFAPPDLVLVHTEDLTEKKHLQAEAIRAGHLASLGELAAGIAHEINNPINGIISYAELLKDQFDEEGGDDEIPVRIIKEGERVAKIVRNLLSFARDRKEDFNPARVRDIVSDAFGLTESQIKKDGIKVVMDIPSGLPGVRMRSQEIQQVFLNIISNARYALNQKYQDPHENKLLEIRGEAVDIDGKSHVRTTFRDAGVGISREILEKIRNPFFSTKPPGEGTGLGLSISHGIIESHGGKIRFESVEGEYTSVVVDLPADDSPKTWS